jgi:hypothetical protein
MHTEFYNQVKLLRWLAMITLLLLVFQFFGGITLVNFNPQQMDAAMRGEPAHIFTEHTPSSRPAQSVLLILLTSGFFFISIFCHTRAAVFIPARHIVLRHILFMIHGAMVCHAVLLQLLLQCAEFFAADEATFRTMMAGAYLALYGITFIGGIEHIILGAWAISSRTIPGYVSWGTMLTALAGFALNLAVLNTDLHPGRLVLGGTILSIEIGIWMFYLWSLQAPYGDSVPTVTVPSV